MSERRYRLRARSQIHGEVREPGYVFTLTEGERGPHKTIVASNVGGPMWRHAKEAAPDGAGWIVPDDCSPMMRDEPLYEEVKEDR